KCHMLQIESTLPHKRRSKQHASGETHFNSFFRDTAGDVLVENDLLLFLRADREVFFPILNNTYGMVFDPTTIAFPTSYSNTSRKIILQEARTSLRFVLKEKP